MPLTLGQTPEYYALSYCWGSQQVHRSTICGDKLIEITPSLSDALLGLRSYLSNRNNREDKWFWVNQLCINQADVQERSYQVSLMGSICSQALRTLIWLGTDDSVAEAGFGLVHTIYGVVE